MAKRKKTKKLVGLQKYYVIGEKVEIRSTIDSVSKNGIPLSDVIKTPALVSSVGNDCMRLRIRRSCGMKFVKGFVIELEGYEFKIVVAGKLEAVVECLDKSLL